MVVSYKSAKLVVWWLLNYWVGLVSKRLRSGEVQALKDILTVKCTPPEAAQPETAPAETESEAPAVDTAGDGAAEGSGEV